MFKKLLALTLLVIGAFTLSACGDKGPTTEEILTMIQEAVDELELPSSTTTDLTLPNSGVHDVEITWSSNKTAVIANDGTVTIPTKTAGNQTVTLTATLTLEDQTLTKTFTVTVTAASEYTNTELLQQAADALVLPVTGIITGSFTPPATGTNGTTITWASSNTAVIAADGTVTRPANGDGNAAVTLTATLTLNSETLNKTIDVIVAEEDPSNAFTTVAALHASTLGDIVEFQGQVVSLFNGGYFLTDGTDVIGIYNPSSTLDTMAVGDTVYVKGAYAKYNTLYQISDVQTEEIVTVGDGTQPFTPVVSSVAGMLALDSTDPLVHGKLYTIVGTLVLGNNADGYETLFIQSGDDKIAFYYSSTEASLDLLYDRVGVKVQIDVTYYTMHSRNGLLITFDGVEADIALAPLTDAEAVVADADASSVAPPVVVDDFTLPTTGQNGTTYGTWASDNAAVVVNGTTGEVTVGAENVEVTFTTTVTKGTESEDAEFTVTVAAPYEADDVLGLEVGDYFQVTGIVYAETYYGFFITSGGSHLFVYTRDYQDDVEPGDEVTLLGYLGKYSGLLQANIYDDEIEIDDTADGTLPTPVETTVEAAATDVFERGTVMTVTARVTVEGSYNDVYLNGLDGGKVKVYYRSNADEIAGKDDDGYFGFVDKWVTLDILTYQDGTVLFLEEAEDITQTVKPTDLAVFAQAVLDNIVVDGLDYVEVEELVLPTKGQVLTGVNIAWSTAVTSGDGDIAGDGTVTFGYGAETVLTLTATVNLGGVDYTRDFEVLIADGDDLGPKTVAEVLPMEDGETVVIQGIISGFSYNNMPVIQDLDGTALYIFSFSFRSTVEVGQEIIVRGDLTTYNGKRELENPVLVELVSEDNDTVSLTDVTPEELGTDGSYAMYEDVKITMELTFSSMDDGHGYYIFDGGDDLDIKFDQDFCDLCATLFAVDESATFTFIVYDINYGSVRVVDVYLEGDLLDDDLQQQAVEELLFLPTTVAEDMDLPDSIDPYEATITWASSNTAVIDTDGTVVRPAMGQANATVTLTATISIGTETDVTVPFTITVPAYPTPEIFISEYIEGSSSNKAIELYNPTGAPITMDGYQILVYSNGNGDLSSPNYTLDLSGHTIASGGVFVVYNASAVQDIKDVGDVSSTITYYNGNDAVALVKDGVIIDVIGVIGEDAYWTVGDGSTGEHTLVRVSTVVAGSGAFVTSEWLVYDQNTYTYLGDHTCDEPTT